jgi:hypothetical protein
MERIDISKNHYDPNVSRIPELIGKHPGVVAPVLHCPPKAVHIVKPLSGVKVSRMMEVEVRIRENYTEVLENLKKVVITIDGKTFEFEKPPYKVNYDTSYAKSRLIKIQAEAIGKGEESENDVLSSYYINVITENEKIDKSKPLVLFAGVIEPKITKLKDQWTPDMYLKCYQFSRNIISHLMHYGFIPSFLKEMDSMSVLIDPTNLMAGMEEYKPVKLVDVLGREKGTDGDKTYTEMISECDWIEPTKTKLGTILRGYHTPVGGYSPNELPDIFEMFAARVTRSYFQFANHGGLPGWDQTYKFFSDVMKKVNDGGFRVPWDAYSLLIGDKPDTLKGIIKKHLTEDGITSVLLCDFLSDLSDFEDVKCLWEETQEAIDLINQETGIRLPLSIAWTTGGDLLGTHPDYAQSAMKMTIHEIESCKIPPDAKLGLIMGEHGTPPGNNEEDIIGVNMEEVRKSIRRLYDQELKKLRSGLTEYHLGMDEFNNNPESPQMSSMEWMVDFLHRGFDHIIIQPYYFLNETIDLFEHLRHWAFELDGIDDHELHGGHEVLPNFRSDFDFRGCRIMITGSVLGRYDKESNVPLISDSYNLLKDSVAKQILGKLNSK